jgi:hypothetical protein
MALVFVVFFCALKEIITAEKLANVCTKQAKKILLPTNQPKKKHSTT